MRRSIATPCPVATTYYTNDDPTFNEDTTTNIEYTTAFQASFRHVKPRRGPAARRAATNFAVHEDEEQAGPPASEMAKRPLSTLSQPAKRVIPASKVEVGANISQIFIGSEKVSHATRNAKPQRSTVAPRRLPPKVSIIPEEVLKEEDSVPERPVRRPLDRDVRRKTLYMPSEDTTQPTMWMGIFSPVKSGLLPDGQFDQGLSSDLTGIAAQMVEKKRRRTSTIQSKAKRVPLQSSAIAQEKAIPEDHVGAPTGKENVPPNHISLAAKAGKPVHTTTTKKEPVVDVDFHRRQFLSRARLDLLSKTKSTSPSSSPDLSTMYEVGKSTHQTDQSKPKNRTVWNAGPRPTAKEDRQLRTTSPRASLVNRSQEVVSAKVPTRFVRPVLYDQPQLYQQVPIIEHIENPAMYEEDWLGQQEIVITQLLNSLLNQPHDKKKPENWDKLRKELVDLYNSQENALIYSRVQAAVLYGSLSLSHEAIFRMQSLANDVGRKKQFLKFWTDNYNSDLLKIALETVIGKQVNMQNCCDSSGSSPGKAGIRKALAQFIEVFLLRNEDIGFKSAGTGGAVNDLGSRTILRSLMLVKALDLLQQNINTESRTCLFRRSAVCKSSVSAVQTLIQMVNPAVGDSLRALRQLGYEVYCEQNAMEEISHHVKNIAVDLRDGVALTRLVELLLYKTSSREGNRIHDSDNNTICMPEGETILIGGNGIWPLSQHLKLPCLSRAAKLWNVHIALAALANVKGITKAIEDVSAADIVDGYREKILKLLWALVGRYGLFGMVDRNDLKQEIRRLSPSQMHLDDLDANDKADYQTQCEHLLKAWTKAVASSKGQVVRNFTTSFSDGQTFKAILDEYEPYLLQTSALEAGTLQQRLLRLGCSRQFSQLFSHTDGQMHIFGMDFVLAALAFLCSRVVGPSKLFRKAIVIQRCWRRYWQSTEKERRVLKRNLAEACAASVNVRQVSDGHTNIDREYPAENVDERTEIENDIWLSL